MIAVLEAFLAMRWGKPVALLVFIEYTIVPYSIDDLLMIIQKFDCVSHRTLCSFFD